MSSVGSAHTPHGDITTTRRGSRIWTDGRLLVGSLIVVSALAIALTDYAGFGYAWSHFFGSSETNSSASTSEVFGGLKSKFRDYNTYSRDIFLMEERSKVDAPYLATIARLLENPAESAGAGPMIEAFLDLRKVLDLEQSCTAGYPWSTPVWSSRRDIDTMADGSKLVALDLFFCLFTVPRDESGIVRYPIATVTLTADESRQLSSIYSHISTDDARNGLRWLEAVVSGEVAHLKRLLELRNASTSSLSDEIDDLLQRYLRTNQAAFEHGVVMTLTRALLLIVLIVLAAVSLKFAHRDRPK
ncbi:hypothetical protein VW23_016685 [Devosia insulae DS-56]|uniref:Transmembrane protein n=1 Tax=Devosia insulae DS-56 TaxID=1116389 RepID=A0A1E5XRT3_9HYPH|nr:hypothetical protein [Devosia insulae]OEO31322.1 hypothetical protein VW23_016685 [Devosia insulae DS-56]